MNLGKIELIVHPVRLRILQTLVGEQLTTQQIAEQLPDVPKSSIYRHLKLLLDGEMISQVEVRLVNGIQEKVYGLSQPAHVGLEEVAGISAEEHFRFFTTYVLTLLRDFATYLNRAAAENGQVNMGDDYAGYTEAMFWASEEELLGFQERLQEALGPLVNNKPGPGRHKHKIALITHPAGSRRPGVGADGDVLSQEEQDLGE